MCRRRMRTHSEWNVEISGFLGILALAQQFGRPLLHFAGGLVGERDRQNAARRGVRCDQLGDADA